MIKANSLVLMAAMPMPLDGLELLNRVVERLYGTGEYTLRFSPHGDAVSVYAPAVIGERADDVELPAPDSDGITVRSTTAVEDRLELIFDDSQDAVLLIAGALAQWFDALGGINYVTARFGSDPEAGHHLTVQRGDRPSAHELREAAETRVKQLEAQLRELGVEPVSVDA